MLMAKGPHYVKFYVKRENRFYLCVLMMKFKHFYVRSFALLTNVYISIMYALENIHENALIIHSLHV